MILSGDVADRGKVFDSLSAVELAEWLVGQAICSAPPRELVLGLCERLRNRGIPLGRLQVAFRILHPLFGAVTITFDEDKDLTIDLAEDGGPHNPAFAASPFYAMLIEGARRMRRRLTDRDAIYPFPSSNRSRSAGLSITLLLPSFSTTGHSMAWPRPAFCFLSRRVPLQASPTQWRRSWNG
jgi:hypothetical protein